MRWTDLVDRWGRTGFALATSMAWFLPLAVWAGSFDIGPPRAWPWLFFWAGLALLAAWCALMARAARVPVAPRRRRIDLGAMSTAERRSYALLFVSLTLLIGWLNAAATVDDAALVRAAIAGSPGAIALLAALLALVAALVAGTIAGWRGAGAAFARRR